MQTIPLTDWAALFIDRPDRVLAAMATLGDLEPYRFVAPHVEFPYSRTFVEAVVQLGTLPALLLLLHEERFRWIVESDSGVSHLFASWRDRGDLDVLEQLANVRSIAHAREAVQVLANEDPPETLQALHRVAETSLGARAFAGDWIAELKRRRQGLGGQLALSEESVGALSEPGDGKLSVVPLSNEGT